MLLSVSVRNPAGRLRDYVQQVFCQPQADAQQGGAVHTDQPTGAVDKPGENFRS